jgi:hypothetical protein
MILLCAIMAGPAFATPIVIAGSTLDSPPPFWTNSFWGITRSIERAFPFTIVPGGLYRVESLQVAAYHYKGLAGSLAYFSINQDDAGKPGVEITTFDVSDISTTQQVLTAQAIGNTILNSNSSYWIVGQTPQGQVNWNLAANVFGTAAYRVSGDDWVILSRRNVSAYSILGTLIPEPATLSLDILPSDCPNLFTVNTQSKGRLPMAILGTEDFDVSDIDPGSISIAGDVFPVKTPSIKDESAPIEVGIECACQVGIDGINDLMLHFSRRDVILALGLDQMELGTEVPITLEGVLLDGTPFMATDCVKIVGRKD